MPILNLKSHGSKQTVASGLYRCQIDAKTNTQIEIIRSKLSLQEINSLNSITNLDDVINNIDQYNNIISKLYLGSNSVYSSINENLDRDLNLGSRNLSNHENTLGTSINTTSEGTIGISILGLGANEGLSAEKSFGLQQITLNEVLADLFNKENKRVLGFAMFESCDTNRDSAFQHTYMNNILGFYSANHSLWYRNLNWWEIIRSSENSTSSLLDKINFYTKKIQNIKTIMATQD